VATQTVEFRAATGLTITAKLFSAGSDTEVASVTAIEATNRKGTYSAAYTDVPAGEYQLIAIASAVPVASWWVTLTLSTATFGVYDKADTRDINTRALDIQSRIPTTLDNGLMRSSVQSMATNVLTASALASDAVAEIQSGLALESTLTVIAGYLDTEIAAIKAKTDNLPSDPASASTLAASFVTVNTKLDAIDDYVDSEVAAIKAVTDKLNGMLVLNGSLYEYTSAALANSPSGTVYVYPMSMEQEPRNTHATITVYTEETGSQYFFAYDSAGTALSLTGKTLEFRVADTKSKQRLYTAKTSDGTLTISLGNKVTFTKSTKFTRFANTDVTYSLRDMDAGGEVLLDGQIELMWAP